MGQLIGITAALGLIALAGVGLGGVDFFFPEQTNAPQAPGSAGEWSPSSSLDQPAAHSAYIAAHTQLSHPLGYSATVRDCLPSGRQCTPTRYYFAKHEGAK